jgi:hypothetical protein
MAAITIFMSLAFIYACSIGLAIISAIYDEESPSLKIKVESNPPGAAVYLDGKKLGNAPITVKIVGLDIEHKIEITKSGYQSKIATVFITPGDTEDQEYLAVARPHGTWSQVENNTLNIVLEKD